MILPYEATIKKIADTKKISQEEVEKKIKEKLTQLQDLISKEGAAHIVANELGVRLFDDKPQTLKIDQVQAGLNSINIIAKILKINDIRTFTKKDRTGRIGSLLVGDETGTIRIVIWDEKLIDLIKDMKEQDIIKLGNGYSKLNNNFKEVHLGSKSQLIINPEGETVGEIKVTKPQVPRKQIKDLQPGDFVELLGTVVQVFEPRYYDSCPVCNKKVFPQGDKFNCAEHGDVPANKTPILNIFFDDGTGNIRAVLFRDQAAKLIDNKEKLEEIKKEALGKQLLIKGKVTKNEMFDRIELVVNNLEEPKPEEILAELEE